MCVCGAPFPVWISLFVAFGCRWLFVASRLGSVFCSISVGIALGRLIFPMSSRPTLSKLSRGHKITTTSRLICAEACYVIVTSHPGQSNNRNCSTHFLRARFPLNHGTSATPKPGNFLSLKRATNPGELEACTNSFGLKSKRERDGEGESKHPSGRVNQEAQSNHVLLPVGPTFKIKF